METIGTPLLWGIFTMLVIVALLVAPVWMRHGGPHRVAFREAVGWSLAWVALVFNLSLWWSYYRGRRWPISAGAARVN